MEDDWMYVKSNTLEKRLDADRRDGFFTDVTFIVGTEKNRCEFKAHKVMLAAPNKEFEDLLYGTEDSTEIELPDVNPKGFENLIRYFYGVNIQIEDISVGRETYCVAEKFKVDKLKRATEKILLKLVNCGTVIEMLKTAVELDIPRLKNRCVGTIASQFSEICVSREFLSNPLKACELILSYTKDLGPEFPKHVVFTILEGISNYTQQMLKAHMLPMIPDIDSFKNRSKQLKENEILLSPKKCQSLKSNAFSVMLKAAVDKVSLPTPEMAIAKGEPSGITVEKPSCPEEVVDQDKASELKDENKNVADLKETLQQTEKEDSDDDEALVGNDVMQNVIERVDVYIKEHLSDISRHARLSFMNTAEDAMMRASERLQIIVDDALFCLEEMSCRNTKGIAKSEADDGAISIQS